MPFEAITVAQLDTDVTPYDVNTNASSSTVVMGLSVQRAAQDLKRQILRHAARILKTKPEKLALRDGKIHGLKDQSLSFEQLMQSVFLSKAGELIGHGAYQDIKSKKAALGSPTNFWEISWGAAEVEVDRDSGEIKLTKYVSLSDVGQAINPVLCEGQDEGGVMNAIGHSLLEEMVYKDGQLLNPNLVDYRVPTFAHVPKDFESILVESRQRPRTLRLQGHRRRQPIAGRVGHRQRDLSSHGIAALQFADDAGESLAADYSRVSRLLDTLRQCYCGPLNRLIK